MVFFCEKLESNIRRRGDVGGSAKKIGKRIKELERLYGIEHGNNRYEKNSSLKTQADLAAQLGISVDTLQNYKMMAEIIPELEELIDTGIVTKTTALAMMRNLSEEAIREENEKKKEKSNKQFYGNRYTENIESSPIGVQSKRSSTWTDIRVQRKLV